MRPPPPIAAPRLRCTMRSQAFRAPPGAIAAIIASALIAFAAEAFAAWWIADANLFDAGGAADLAPAAVLGITRSAFSPRCR